MKASGAWSRLPAAIRERIGELPSDGRAVAVGDDAGILHWASEGWRRLTGYALDRASAKPIVEFLREAQVEPEAVDYVAAAFASGRGCSLELALRAPDGSLRHIDLSVEAVADAAGRASEFIARARASGPSERAAAESGGALVVEEIDLSQVAARAAAARSPQLPEMTALDFSLAPDLPAVLAERSVLEAIVEQRIVDGAAYGSDVWSTVTLSTGVLGEEPGPLYEGDLWRRLPQGHFVFLEVHHTAGTLSDGAAGRPGHASDGRLEPALLRARSRLRHYGGELCFQRLPWLGSSLLLLLPFADEPTGWRPEGPAGGSERPF